MAIGTPIDVDPAHRTAATLEERMITDSLKGIAPETVVGLLTETIEVDAIVMTGTKVEIIEIADLIQETGVGAIEKNPRVRVVETRQFQ